MSINGYKPKWKKAPWTTAFPDQVILPGRLHDKDTPVRFKFKKGAFKYIRIRPISKRRSRVMTGYRKEARAFVKAAIDRGETCPVVMAIYTLHTGHKYGHPISNKLNEVHHIRGRAGKLLMDERFWMPVSKQGHRWIHEHPAEARRRGWLCAVGQWNTPVKKNEKSS